MDVTIIGTGNMARAIGTRALAGGHSVTILGKEAEKAESLAEELRPHAAQGATVETGTSDQPLEGDIVVLAVYYPDAMTFVEENPDELSGKTVVDVTNPIDFETFDGLVTPPGSSAAEELQQAAPGARFVKAFNTTFAGTLVAGQVAGNQLDVFIAGDDEEAKAKLAELLESCGVRAIDAGPLRRARELEALGFLHISLQEKLGTGFQSAAKIVA